MALVADPTVAIIVSVSAHETYRFSKTVRPEIEIVAGLGVAGDVHAGVTVKHRSRVAVDPTQPNLRQVHLIAAELLDELGAQGFAVAPSDLGENIVTRGIDLLALPRGARLRLGASAVVEITGLRNPCGQIDAFRPGLLGAVLIKGPDGALIRKAGVMAVAIAGGVARPGDPIEVALPAQPHQRLERV